MLNDRNQSELISKSLSGVLGVDQQKQVERAVAGSGQSTAYAKLSRLIQDSLSDVARKSTDGDDSVAPGLSADARSRLKKSLRSESARLKTAELSATVASASDSTVQNPSSRTLRRSSQVPDDLGQRTMNGKFSLLREIGEGGLGTVWLARDESLKRNVALKEMKPEAAEFPRAWERFQREAEITGQLEHPNVVSMYQFGTDDTTGQPFYAMRFVGKRTLVDAIEEYHERKAAGEDVTMDQHRLLTAFNGVCQAIAYAHSRNVIHRDLKPENVGLDNFGQVIVLDWGLAKITDEHEHTVAMSTEDMTSESAFNRTMAGEIIGTPLYMAPEQAAGRQDDVDHRTDIYGLGAIMFAMLTGNAPHQQSLSGNERISVPALLKLVSDGPSPRPRDYVPSLPSGLEAICVKAMQLKPHSRYQSVTEMADAVQRWIAGRSERRQQYTNARSECRELRSTMLASVRDLERNVRFMSCLPPLQEIIDTESGRGTEELAKWRERLGVIYSGLLRTNCDFSSVSFARVNDGEFEELIRIERQRNDPSNVRSIPASRLSSGKVTTCMQKALDGKPDEVYVSLSSECPSAASKDDPASSRLVAAVPVFDEVTEELFGYVMIEACLARLIDSQIRDRFRAHGRLFVLDNDCRILLQVDPNGSRVHSDDGQMMSTLSKHWDCVLPTLKSDGEFVDDDDHSMYATRIDLVPGRYSLALALCLGKR